MRVSERNETCFNCRTEAVSHLQNAKTQKCKITKMQKVLNQFSQLTKKTHIFCSEKKKKANPCIGAAPPQHSPSAMGRQKKWLPIRAAIYQCIKLCLQYRVMTRFLGQSQKASSSTSHPSGMEMLVRLEQPSKALLPISVTDGGMRVFSHPLISVLLSV